MSDFTSDLLKEAVIRNNELRNLIANWRQLADKLDDDPASTACRVRLRQCAKELEEALTK